MQAHPYRSKAAGLLAHKHTEGRQIRRATNRWLTCIFASPLVVIPTIRAEERAEREPMSYSACREFKWQ